MKHIIVVTVVKKLNEHLIGIDEELHPKML